MRLRPRPVSMFFAGSGVSHVDRVLVVLHEDEVPVLEEALVVVAGQVVARRPTPGRGRGRARCTARTGRSGRTARSSPARAAGRSARAGRRSARHASIASSSGPRPSSSSPPKTVIQIVLGLKPKPCVDSSQRELDGALLEVVADREVAEHLEEREVARGVADVLDVGRAEALLAARQPVVRRLLDAREVGLERVHARGREQDRRIERRRDERGRRQAPVAARLEERQEGLADLVGSHATIVAHPTTTSPRSRHGDLAGRGAVRRARRARAVAVGAGGSGTAGAR